MGDLKEEIKNYLKADKFIYNYPIPNEEAAEVLDRQAKCFDRRSKKWRDPNYTGCNGDCMHCDLLCIEEDVEDAYGMGTFALRNSHFYHLLGLQAACKKYGFILKIYRDLIIISAPYIDKTEDGTSNGCVYFEREIGDISKVNDEYFKEFNRDAEKWANERGLI